jgi:hypothetical protein
VGAGVMIDYERALDHVQLYPLLLSFYEYVSLTLCSGNDKRASDVVLMILFSFYYQMLCCSGDFSSPPLQSWLYGLRYLLGYVGATWRHISTHAHTLSLLDLSRSTRYIPLRLGSSRHHFPLSLSALHTYRGNSNSSHSPIPS